MATIENISALLSSVNLPEEALTAFHFPSRSIILEEGKVADKLYYVRSGCLRLAFNNDGKDITFQFFFPGDIVASFDSLHNGTPSLFSLESIEPSELLAIDGKELDNISGPMMSSAKNTKNCWQNASTPTNSCSFPESVTLRSSDTRNFLSIIPKL